MPEKLTQTSEDIEFLNSLPPLQQVTIKKYAEIHELTYSDAYDLLIRKEASENIKDRH